MYDKYDPRGRVLTAVVSYNPDIPLFTRSLRALCVQLDPIIVYDNGSANIGEIRELIGGLDQVHLIENGKNLGLPLNYNRAAALAVKGGYPWLLLMDQDTVIPEAMIRSFLRYSDQADVAIITPVIWDTNLQSLPERKAAIPKTAFTYLDEYITTASLNRVSVIKELGGFDEKLFIDWVDLHYARDVLNHGYKILRDNHSIVRHCLGDGGSREVKLLWRRKVISPHSPFRYYYIYRNMTCYNMKYRTYRQSRAGRLHLLFDMVKNTVWLFYEKQTFKKVCHALAGIRDGYALGLSYSDRDSK